MDFMFRMICSTYQSSLYFSSTCSAGKENLLFIDRSSIPTYFRTLPVYFIVYKGSRIGFELFSKSVKNKPGMY